ncbi:MAG: glycosyltransferase family 39 protein [Thermoleophilia bacterium]
MAKKFLILPFFIVLAMFAYWSIMNNGPVADDWGLIYRTADMPVNGLWRLFLVQAPLFIRPIPFFTVWLFYQLFGLNLMPSHLLNVGMHAINAFLLVWFLAKIGIPRRTGYLAAILFLVTPIGAESVGWTTGRFDVWALFFILLTLGLYSSYLEQGKWSLYAGALLAAIAAWLSKEPSMILIGIIPTLELLFLTVPVNNSQMEKTWHQRWRSAIRLSSIRLSILFVLFAGYIAMRYAIMGRLGGAPYVPMFGTPSLRATAGTVVALLAPLDRLVFSREPIILLAAYVGMLYALSLGLVVMRWQQAAPAARRAWLFLAAFFVASLVPIYSYVFMTGLSSYLTNSRMYYLSYVPFISLMVIGLLEFGWKKGTWRIAATLALLVLVPIFITGLNHNNRVWENAAAISFHIGAETRGQLPDPPAGARLYFQNVPKLQGAHILASALQESTRLIYNRRDLEVFYVNPDPALRSFFPDHAAESGDGYLFEYHWDTGQLQLVRSPVAGT